MVYITSRNLVIAIQHGAHTHTSTTHIATIRCTLLEPFDRQNSTYAVIPMSSTAIIGANTAPNRYVSVTIINTIT